MEIYSLNIQIIFYHSSVISCAQGICPCVFEVLAFKNIQLIKNIMNSRCPVEICEMYGLLYIYFFFKKRFRKGFTSVTIF